MPSVSGDQQRFMRMAYERKKAGRSYSTDPKMSLGKLHDLTRKVPGAPERASQNGYGKGPVSERT